MDSGLLETDPKHTGEDPGGAPDVTKENGRSRTQSLAMHRAPHASTSEGTRAQEVNESPAGSAIDIAESSKRSVPRRVSPNPKLVVH